MRRYYVLFFIAHASRRVCRASCTTNPTGAWVTQQARDLGLDFADQGMRFLIRDRDSKFSGSPSASVTLIVTWKTPDCRCTPERTPIRQQDLDLTALLSIPEDSLRSGRLGSGRLEGSRGGEAQQVGGP